jgi:hypothetical protein
MKLFGAAVAFFILVGACSAQSPGPPTGDELDARIKPLSDQQLIDCLKEKPKSCPLEGLYLDRAWIRGELGDRHHPDLLIAAYGKATPEDRSDLVEALWEIDDPKVLTFMRSIAFRDLDRGQDSFETFFPLDYLARRCDQHALARLNRRVNFDKSFPMGCIYFAPTVAAFGRCNYRAAAPNLVLALNAACLNITGAAEEGLQKFFPGSCVHEKSIEDEARCYKKLLNDPPNPK